MRQRLTDRLLKAQEGFTTVVVMGVLLVGGMLVAAAFAASDGDTGVTRHDQYYKQAYEAAEAGVAWYLSHLDQNTNYWQNCYTAPVYAPGTAYSASTSQPISTGAEPRFEIELLNAPGQTGAACSASQSATVINPSTGELKIRSTGYYRGIRRTVIGTFKRKGFLNFLWFTDKETPDPLTYTNGYGTQASASCTVYARDGRPNNANTYCQDQIYGNGEFLKGPIHTNDRLYICGAPTFGRGTLNGVTYNDSIEATDPAGVLMGNCTNNPTYNGTTHWGAASLDPPQTNQALSSNADAAWIFSGVVHVTLNNSSVTVTNSNGTVLKTGFPPKGVIYVNNSSGGCGTGYAASLSYPKNDGCGDAWVHGNSSKDLTIGTANDIIVDGNVTHDTGVVIGLISQGFTRLYHPCISGSNAAGPAGTEDAGVNYLTDPEIDAAIMSVQHSWQVDNWDCGAGVGTITITGAIAQLYRGTVGRGTQHGYLKGYAYDPNLKYHQPPYFLDPTSAKWDLFSQTEQVPTH
jgi:Tfp pilus assembly protein PilX